ncbi:response regulator transcription factor [Marasmitruncus massiliensis]|uniref:response regulator transcription factor n=1 Tax=Marasmitruncus massiliensis TaxID=1944642 RepID=UPI000C7E6A42|nr:response regulator transcription factor [Marasmitruncus massiliensis]
MVYATILIVSDSYLFRGSLKVFLKKEQFAVLLANKEQEIRDALDETRIQLIIADTDTLLLQVYDLVAELRSNQIFIPIILTINRRISFQEKKIGFEAGADDYMTPPIDFEELLLKIRVLLRRYGVNTNGQVALGKTILDCDSFQGITPQGPVQLTRKEFLLLFTLFSHPKKIFSRQMLMDCAWGICPDCDSKMVSIYICRIRKKFADKGNFEIITRKGIGYQAIL